MHLGIDIGTSSVKAVLTNDDADVIEQATSPLRVSRPFPLWSEQEPDDWWRAANAAVAQLSPDRRSRVASIGLSGQMHGATLLGADDRPLRPAILWNDGRSHAECAMLEAAMPASRKITGNLAMPGFTAPKLLWVRQHEPKIFARVAKVLLPKDYVRLQMTGEYATDLSDASGTLWVDVAARRWSEEMVGASGLTAAAMPTLLEGPAISGQLRADVAANWGMSRVPVAAGGGDNAAGAVGVGVTRHGEGFLSLGTSGVLFAAGKAFRPNPEKAVHAFCHALPGAWHQMTVMLSAASCVDWAARITGTSGAAALIAAAEAEGRLDRRGIFLPYLSGERTPHNDPYARGVLFGLDHDTTPAMVGQLVLEGIALAFADGLDALGADAGLAELTVIGGGARSAYWGRILSAALNLPLTYRRDAEVGPAFGAAKLGMLAANATMDGRDLPAPPVLSRIEPNPADVDLIRGKLDTFRRLYHQTRTLFAEGN